MKKKVSLMEKELFEKLLEDIKKERRVSTHSYYRAGEYLHIIISKNLYKIKYTTIPEFARVELKTSPRALEYQVRVYTYLSKLSERMRKYILDVIPQSGLLYVAYLLQYGGDEFYDEARLKEVIEKWEKLTVLQMVRDCKKLLGDKYPKPHYVRKPKENTDNQIERLKEKIKKLQEQKKQLQLTLKETRQKMMEYKTKYMREQQKVYRLKKQLETLKTECKPYLMLKQSFKPYTTVSA